MWAFPGISSRLFLLAVLLWLVTWAALAQEPAKEKPLTLKQKEKLRERDALMATFKDLLFEQGKVTEAFQTYDKILAIERDVFGAASEEIVASLEILARLHEGAEVFPAARKARQEILDIRTRLHGKDDHRATDARLALEHIDLLGKLDVPQRRQLSEAEGLSSQAAELHGQGKSREAIALALKVVAIRKQILGEKHADYATSLNNLAGLYKWNGDLAKAESLCRQALEIRKQLLGEKHPDYAQSLSNLAEIYSSQGDYAKAEPFYRQALEIRKQALGEKHPDYALSLNDLALLYYLQGEYAKAEPLYRRTLEVTKQVLGEKHPDYATSLNNLAELYRAQGEYARAEPFYRQALEIRKQALGEKHPDYAISLNNLAEFYSALGDYAQAEPLHRQALEIRKQVLGEKHPDYATSLNNLASLCMAQGDYANAEPFYRQASEIFKQAVGEKHPAYATSLNNLATLYHAQGDYAKAEPLFRQVLEVRKQVLGEKHPAYATSLNNLAGLYKSQRDYARAEPLYRQALAAKKQVLGEKHPDYATSLNNLATVYDSQGDYTRAEPLYRQALEIRKLVLGERHPDYATSLNNLAELYRAQGEYARAEPFYRQASEIFKQALGEMHPNYATSLSNLALLYKTQGDYAKAEPLFRQVLAIARRQIDLSAAVQSERQQLVMSDSLRHELDAVLSACQEGKLPALLGFREMLPWKGSVLVKQRQLQLAGREPKLMALAEELRQISGQLATLAFATPTPPQREAHARQIVAQNERKERLEAELADKSTLFREGQELAQLTPEQLQKVLPANTVLVDFLEYEHSSPDKEKKGKLNFERRMTAFVVLAKGEIVRLDLGPAAPITKAVDDWRTVIARGHRPTSEADDPANMLRKLIWRPLEEHVKGAKLVLLSPDGAISRLPFAALPGSKLGTYLIEEQALVVVPVPQLLPAILKETTNAGESGLLAIGDVEYGGEAGQRDNQVASRGLAIVSNTLPTAPEAKRPKWSPLAATGPESDAIAKLFQQRFPEAEVKSMRKEGATEAAFRQLAPKHRYLHIATHGFFADETVRSALYPSEKQADPFLRQRFGDQGFIGHNPELLSGLVLVGANSPIKPDHDDGILTALEIRNLALDNVELAVLSACETGLGAVAGGEGILGLQRAFQAAGARTVVTSLWQIPDQPTQLLMERFYTNLWQKKMSKLEALREAQLWMLREGVKHPGIKRGLKIEETKPADPKDGKLPPLYWAAFVLSGDWR